MDFVRCRVSLEGQPAAATGSVEPALELAPCDVAPLPNAVEVILNVGSCVVPAISQLAAEPEFGVWPGSAARTRNSETHLRGERLRGYDADPGYAI
jgi:hypothetical protein